MQTACKLVLLVVVVLGASPVQPESAAPRSRRPVALALIDKGARLLIANRDAGSVAVLDTQALRVISELKVGRKLSDLVATADGGQIAVTDEEAGELIVLAHRQGTLTETRRAKTPSSPVSVRLDGTLATVACLWPHQLVLVNLAAEESRPITLDLPFAPRRQTLLPHARLAVADAFGGQLAVVDLGKKEVESVRGLNVHNLRGLALSPGRDQLLLVHQVLHSQGRPNDGDIRSGSLIANQLRKLPVDTVLGPRLELLRGERIYSLGDVERGAGDPADVVETADGLVLVTLAGLDELLVGRPEQVLWERVPVEGRPTALAVDEGRGRAYVANVFSDSISVVDYRKHKTIATVRLGPPPAELLAEERGERLFYDARLSLDAWFSCHSCHPDGHSNGRLNDNFSDRSFGTPKRVLSLLGARDSGPWAWNGGMSDLKTQVHSSITSTMRGQAPTAAQVADLAAYVRTLAPAPSVPQARGSDDPETFERGRQVFVREKCATCHSPPTYTTPKTYDVGLRDEAGEKLFNPPSLRGVSQAGPYFHDNRARTLEDVFRRFRHRLAGELTEQELADLVHYLRTL